MTNTSDTKSNKNLQLEILKQYSDKIEKLSNQIDKASEQDYEGTMQMCVSCASAPAPPIGGDGQPALPKDNDSLLSQCSRRAS